MVTAKKTTTKDAKIEDVKDDVQEASARSAEPTSAPLNVYDALRRAQNDIGPIFKNADNPHFRSSFLDLAGLLDAVQPSLFKNNLTLFHTTRYPRNEREDLTLVARLVFTPTGEEIISVYPLRTDKPNDPQKLGSVMTYARRYTAMAVLGLAPEDDDGNFAAGHAPSNTAAPRKPAASGNKPPQASATKPASEKQIDLIESLLKKGGYTSAKAQDEFTKGVIGKTLDDALSSKDASDLITVLKEDAATPAASPTAAPF